MANDGNVERDAGGLAEAIPVTLLTGFLGAGKTTLVNHLLTGEHDRRLAVIVNEFGELGIDAALIKGASGSVIELANGCICCATQGDLSRAIQEVLALGDELDGILIETSGLADPVPVIHDLDTRRFARDIRLDGVVTVIDAANFDRNLDSAEAAYQQITCGDVLLINKIDLVANDVPGLIERGIWSLNPTARVLRCAGCEVPLDVVLGQLRRPPAHRERDSEAEHAHGAHHHDDFESTVLTVDRPLVPERLAAWLDALPNSIYRAKGFVRFAGASAPVVLHVVGARHSIEATAPEAATTGAKIVVIGRHLALAELQAGLEACAG